MQHHKPECHAEKKKFSFFKAKVTARADMTKTMTLLYLLYLLYNYSLATEHFVTKLAIVMHHHEPECMQKDWFAIFKVKVTARPRMIKI